MNKILKDSEGIITSITTSYNGINNDVDKMKIYELFRTLYMECVFERTRCVNNYEFLKIELLAFEKTFQRYVSSIYQIVLGNTQYKNIYYENFKIIAGIERTHLINFNYTSITDVLERSNDNLKEMNVHGKYDGNVIFGIEQIACETDEEYIFSKTYRKIEDYSQPMTLPQNQPPRQEHQNIIFYGHSLSEADYSYFQSVFDLYDIYNQTTLTFKYSIYDERQRSAIAGRTFKSVTKLLQNYGKTMNNTNHGKNLIHKLLLEGRLILEEVTLQDMSFKFEDTKTDI